MTIFNKKHVTVVTNECFKQMPNKSKRINNKDKS